MKGDASRSVPANHATINRKRAPHHDIPHSFPQPGADRAYREKGRPLQCRSQFI